MAVQTLTTASFDSAPTLHHDYWPLAREYSIWNAPVATLQFGQLILNPTSSVAPLNESMPHFSVLPPCTCYITNLKKFYLVAL